MSDFGKQEEGIDLAAYILILSAAAYAGLVFFLPMHKLVFQSLMVGVAGSLAGPQLGWFSLGYIALRKIKDEFPEGSIGKESQAKDQKARKLNRCLLYLVSSFASVQGVIVASLAQENLDQAKILACMLLWLLLGIASFYRWFWIPFRRFGRGSE